MLLLLSRNSCKMTLFKVMLLVNLMLLLYLLIFFQTAQQRNQNIILLTYHRSGSSFVGESLAAHEDFSFYFEPLFYPSHVLANNSRAAYNAVMESLLNCQSNILDILRQQNIWILRKFGPVWDTFKNETAFPPQKLAGICTNTPHHLAKTIRLRLRDAIELVRKNVIPNLKILHLVRDPRARYNSFQNEVGSWNNEERSADTMCRDMEEDANFSDVFPPNVYRLLRYEDMVKDTTGTVLDIYKFLGVQKITPRVKLYIQRHTKAENTGETASQATGYYSTYRNSTFDYNHWKKSLSSSTIALIQAKCSNVLSKYGYEIMNV